MKTREELEAMTKPEIDTYSNEMFGIDLDGRLAKDTLIGAVLEAQQAKAALLPDGDAGPQTPAGDDEPEASEDAEAPDDADANDSAGEEAAPAFDPDALVSVTVTRFSVSSGVALNVSGKRFYLPIGKPVCVPAWVLPTLDTIDLTYIKE